MSKIHSSIVVAAMAVAASLGVYLYQFRNSALLREQVRLQHERITQTDARELELKTKVDALNLQLGSNQPGQAELHKLRGEVTALRLAGSQHAPRNGHQPSRPPAALSETEDMEAHHIKFMAEVTMRGFTDPALPGSSRTKYLDMPGRAVMPSAS